VGHLVQRFPVGIAVFAAMIALAGCGASPDAQPAGATSVASQTRASATGATSTESAPDAPPASKQVDQEVFEYTHFRSPSANVGCVIKPGYARCDIDERDWSPPPRPADCEWDYGQGIAIATDEPAQFVCAGDTTQAPDADPLPYGESITAGQMSCESAETGITCRDAQSGSGFTISREAYRLF
jgi:hypothetical protein